MIKVGFIFYHGQGWLGGLNYFRNLFNALCESQVGIEPFAIIPQGGSGLPAGFPPIPEQHTALVRQRSAPWVARMAVRELTGRDFLLEHWLRRHGIDVLSHSGPLGRLARIPSISWIPDFQHRRLRDFFSPAETANRERTFTRMCRGSTRILLSSEAALQDLEEFYPEAVPRARVLRFTDCSAAASSKTTAQQICDRYQIKDRYFFLPNQFWQHKNHGLVLEALAILRSKGRNVLVVATGNTEDSRQPNTYKALMAQKEELGLSTEFRSLGIVPYDDLAALMRRAVAVINPSRFEGWSTTVEEAKSLGKLVLLSDIKVHREQAPDRGKYFGVDDAGELAEEMWKAWCNYKEDREFNLTCLASEALPARRTKFAYEFANIVQQVVEDS